MSSIEVAQATGARTGEQFLEGLRRGGREIWLHGERITHPLRMRMKGMRLAQEGKLFV